MIGIEMATFIVNGKAYEAMIEPQMTLLDVLRESLGFKGAKFVCGSGDCGACTVLIDGKAVSSCNTLAVNARNKQIETIEGLSKGGTLHPLQQSFIDCGAVQCGSCTPGMILTAKALLDENPDPTAEEVKSALGGNLCRCTGYVKTIEAVLSAAKTMNKERERKTAYAGIV